eukprot:scaffold231335_cov25-Prasinocladus_malaysianus.AAC.4
MSQWAAAHITLQPAHGSMLSVVGGEPLTHIYSSQRSLPPEERDLAFRYLKQISWDEHGRMRFEGTGRAYQQSCLQASMWYEMAIANGVEQLMATQRAKELEAAKHKDKPTGKKPTATGRPKMAQPRQAAKRGRQSSRTGTRSATAKTPPDAHTDMRETTPPSTA